MDDCVTSCLPFVDFSQGNRCVSAIGVSLREKVLSFKHTWRAVCVRLLSSGSRLWLRTDIAQWFVFVLWSVPSENVNGSLVGKCELDVSHVFSFPSAKVYLCFFRFLKESKYVKNLLYAVEMYADKITNYRTVLFWTHFVFFSEAAVNLREQFTVAQLRVIEMNFCDCTSVQCNSLLSGNWTADRKVKLNFHWYFPRACIPLGSIQDQWQWPRQEEGNLTFSWGLKPLLWMAGVNTSNQEQMFGFLTWPSPFHGNVENSGSDPACMPYSKWPGSTSVVLVLWDPFC